MKFLSISFSFMLLAIFVSSPVKGEPAINCHCFQDRSFDPAHPEKVEPYLLATAQSSFLSTAFGVDKTELVRRRMSGTRAEDLWIAICVARKKGVAFEKLLAARSREGSWKTTLLKSGVRPTDLEGPAAAALKGGTDQALASAVADESISRKLGVAPQELAGLRARGATTPELVLAAFLGRRTGRPLQSIWSEVKAGETSWGILANNSGVVIGKMEGEFARILKRAH